MKKIFILFLFLAQIQFISAKNGGTEVVQKFGETFSTWCSTGNDSLRVVLEEICSGPIICTIEDVLLNVHVGDKEMDTFRFVSYLNMIQTFMVENNVNYEIKNIKHVKEKKKQEGRLLVTADIEVSGRFNYKAKKIFVVRGENISAIYDYHSKRGQNLLN